MADPPNDSFRLSNQDDAWVADVYRTMGWSRAEQAASNTGEAIEDRLLRALEAELAKLAPKIAEARAARPDKGAIITSLLGSISELAADGDVAGVKKRLSVLEPALDKLIASKPETEEGSGFSVRALGKARIEWIGVREAARSDIERLKTTIRAAYASHPLARGQVEAGVARLDAILGRLNKDLAEQLDAVLGAADPATRKAAVGKVTATAAAFRAYAESDPLARAVDDTGFLPGAKIMAPVRAKLTEIEAAIASAG